jgi:hypothetical protein
LSQQTGGGDERAREKARRLEEAQKAAIVAPARVSNQRSTIEFLARIQERACRRQLTTVVDLQAIRSITIEGCLLLTAELERCARSATQSVYAVMPVHESVCRRLDTFGFYSHLRLEGPVELSRRRLKKPQKDTIVVKSGLREDIKDKLNDIAAVTTALFGDSAYAEAVEIALQEAMTNVMSHAFDGPDPEREARQPGRWWFAGRIDRKRREAVFYALDHGVGIPARAPETIGDEIAEYWSLQTKQPRRILDKHILEAAVRARRKAGIVSRHNYGLPTMIGLVEDDSEAGSVDIHSRGGAYTFSKKVHQNGHPVPAERCYGLQQPFPGTLVVWRLAGPAVAIRG